MLAKVGKGIVVVASALIILIVILAISGHTDAAVSLTKGTFGLIPAGLKNAFAFIDALFK